MGPICHPLLLPISWPMDELGHCRRSQGSRRGGGPRGKGSRSHAELGSCQEGKGRGHANSRPRWGVVVSPTVAGEGDRNRGRDERRPGGARAAGEGADAGARSL
jgi:hypothetical protein